jgi:hypothetical protein
MAVLVIVHRKDAENAEERRIFLSVKGINLVYDYRLDMVVGYKIIFSKFTLSVLRASAVNYPH